MKFMAPLLFACLLVACGKPRPLTIEESEAWMIRQQCRQEATNANPFFPGPDNPAWASDFVMCMQAMGIPDTAIERVW